MKKYRLFTMRSQTYTVTVKSHLIVGIGFLSIIAGMIMITLGVVK